MALLGRQDPAARAQAHLVARESAGNPLFIDELVDALQAGGRVGRLGCCRRASTSRPCSGSGSRRSPTEPSGCWRWSRSQGGRSTSRWLSARRAGSGGRVALAALRSARLIRSIGPAGLDQIEIYHDRIRETVLTHLSPGRPAPATSGLPACWKAPGRSIPRCWPTISGSRRRPARLRLLYQAADKAARAGVRSRRPALPAGHRSSIAIRPPTSAGCGRKLGDALVHSGRGAEAADGYLQAAGGDRGGKPGAHPAGLDPAPHQRPCRLRGWRCCGPSSAPSGSACPRPPQAALLSLIHRRAMLRLRGLRFRSRDETQVSAEDLTRIDLCWSAVAGLSVIDPDPRSRLPDPGAAPGPSRR